MEEAGGRVNLSFLCQPDLPAGPFELAVLPCSRQGEAELTRDLLQSAAQRLAVGGTLVAAVDNPRDHWLGAQLQELFPKATAERYADATAYRARKVAEPRRVRDFRCRFAYRDRDRLLQAVSRPGVFSHRRVDAGARQLLAAAETEQQQRVLDVGCGWGAVALAIAARDSTVAVHAVDGNARAVECTMAGAALNGLVNVTAEVNAFGQFGRDGQFDLALANPPYYADFRIAELFIAAARRALRPGGRLLAVTKHPQWYEERLPGQWRDVQTSASKQYYVVSAARP